MKNFMFEEYNNLSKKDKFIQFFITYCLMPIALLILLIICVLILSSTARASSAQDYFPMYQNNNGHFSEELKVNIANRFDSINNYVLVYYQYYNPNSGYGRYYYYYLAFPKSSSGMWYGEKYTNLEQFSLYQVGQTNFLQGGFYCDRRTPNTIEGVTSSNNPGQWMQGLYSSNYNSSIDYVSNFQIYTDNTSAKQIVLLYDDGVSIPDGDTAREDMEKPDISNYIPDWTNPPSFDNSSVESALESVYDIISWLGNNVKDTIKGSASYVVDSLMWGFQRVLDTIRDKIDEVKTTINNAINGVVSIIDNIKGTITYIGEPLSLSDVQTAWNSSSTYGIYSSFSSFYTTFDSTFESVTEPQDLRIPVHIENISIFYNFGCTTPVYIDLSQYGDFRTPIRAFCWVFVTVGAVFLTENQLSMWLQGGSSSSGETKGGG